MEHVKLIKQIKTTKCYYRILGVKKNSSAEEIKRAYRKLCLKVHPDKNEDPGSAEAFNKVNEAFSCLSDDTSRRKYDYTALVDQYQYNQQQNVRHRRSETNHDSSEKKIDPNRRESQKRTESDGGGPKFFIILLVLPLLIYLLAYMPISEPDYSLHKNLSYSIPMATEKHGVEFFVKSLNFDARYPLGSPARAEIENSVMRDYRNLVSHYCDVELQRLQWNKNLPTPHCAKLNNLEVA